MKKKHRQLFLFYEQLYMERKNIIQKEILYLFNFMDILHDSSLFHRIYRMELFSCKENELEHSLKFPLITSEKRKIHK